MVKIVITAPRGKMDKLIVKMASQSTDIQIVGGLGPLGRNYIGMDIGIAAGLGYEVGALVYDDLEKIIDQCDIVIDFSTVTLSMHTLDICLMHKKALICGTTGFTDEQAAKFMVASKHIPVLKAANTSYVSNVMKKLLGITAAALDERTKIEIIDYHDEKKVDAPSGTAKEFAEEMADHSSKDISEIDFHSIRAGDISSTHTVLFGCMGERLEITHRCYNWECCARGACDAIRFLAVKPVGFYTMDEVVSV